MLTAAVVGPPLLVPPSPVLLFDALPDTLTGDGGLLRLLVPVAAVGGGTSLTEGVQAVVSWAWEMGNVEVTALYDDHLLFDDLERGFIEDDADHVISCDDVAGAIVQQLAGAMPAAALVCALYDTRPDAFTEQVMRECLALRIPVFDASQGMLQLSVYDLDGWETAPAPEDAQEAAEEAEEEPADGTADTTQPPELLEVEGIDLNDDDADEPSLPVVHGPECVVSHAEAQAMREALQEARHDARVIMARAQRRIVTITELLGDGTNSQRNGTEISKDGGRTWEPRGRGRAPAGSIERDAVTHEILRRN